MRISRFLGSAALAFGAVLVAPASALPTFQAYVNGAGSGTNGGDEDTWFHAGSSFDLAIVAAYGPKDLSASSVTLLLSVPKGEQGTFTITSAADEAPILVSTAGGVTAAPLNPATNADRNLLTNVAGLDGYGTKDFLPAGANFNSHYPFQDGVSDFLLFDLSAFDKGETGLNNYNAETGVITLDAQAVGEQKDYSVSFTGFSQVHIDVYGLITTENGTQLRTTWDINPGSHDSTAHGHVVPAPGAFLLASTGLGLVAAWRRRSVR